MIAKYKLKDGKIVEIEVNNMKEALAYAEQIEGCRLIEIDT
jgi:hypothetical protein